MIILREIQRLNHEEQLSRLYLNLHTPLSWYFLRPYSHPSHDSLPLCDQVPIFNIMRKFDGVTVTDDIRLGRRRMRVTRLPRCLCLHMKRFTKVGGAAPSCRL